MAIINTAQTNEISQDAIFSFIWHGMDEDTRQIVCLLAEISSETAFERWRQMSGMERTALRSALRSMILDHWAGESKRYSQPPQDGGSSA